MAMTAAAQVRFFDSFLDITGRFWHHYIKKDHN
jgi:hypothetical protein